MKRFTETGKWADPWFRKLDPKIKLLWQYILDSCDAAGVFEFDADMASYLIGMKVEDGDLNTLADRVSQLPSGRWLVTKFIRFQYGELSTECRPHRVVFEALRKHGLEYSEKGYPIPYLLGVQYPSRQEKDKDKDKKGDTKGVDNLPTSPRSKMVAKMFRREETTPWSDKEISAFKKLKSQTDEDFALVEEYYRLSRSEFLRHDLGTFLNNFTGEVDRARAWKATKTNGNGKPKTAAEYQAELKHLAAQVDAQQPQN